MKYKTGDKFIIEIECRSNINQGLYKVKGFNTLVFDDNGLDRLTQVWEQGKKYCKDCEYADQRADELPCRSCSAQYVNRWTPKTEEIQVGDEVEHQVDNGEEKGIVLYKEHDELIKNKIWLRVLKDQKGKYAYWSEELCHRTGKTYPELIKALESLPKE